MTLARVASPRVTSSDDGIYTTGSSTTMTLDKTSRLVLLDVAASGARTITLPAAVDCPMGHTIRIRDIVGDATAHNVTLAAASGDTLNGTGAITTNYKEVVVTSNGVLAWSVLA